MYHVVLYTRCRFMYCMVLYVMYGGMGVMHTMCMCTQLRKRHWCFSGVETNLELYKIKTKVETKD